MITKHCTVSIFHFYLYSFFPKKTHLQRIRPPNQDYYAPCPVYIHLTTKNTGFFGFGKRSFPKKSPWFSWPPPWSFQGCLAALPPTAVGSPERPWRCWNGGVFFSGQDYGWLLGSHTVDGWNPAPVDMVNIPLFIGFYTSQVQDFSHQQYVCC